MDRKVGYARVSTVGQTLDTQIKSLKKFGCKRIFREKASGADGQRVQLRKMVQTLQEGDTVVVTRIDRLARSTFDLFGIVRDITQKKRGFTHWRSHGLIRLPVRAALCLRFWVV